MADPPPGFIRGAPPPGFVRGGQSADPPSALERANREFVQGVEGFGLGVQRGLAGDVVGAGQLAQDVLPEWMTKPVSESAAGKGISRFANAPSGGIAEKTGRFVGGALPFVAQPELGVEGLLARLGLGARTAARAAPIIEGTIAGGAGGAAQPTPSGSLGSHAVGAGLGAALGAVGGSLAGSQAQQAMRAAGVRTTPAQAIPVVGREAENLAARLPVLNRLIGYGRQTSLGDFNRALYEDALEPLRQSGVPIATPASRGSEGLDQLHSAITGRLNTAMAGSSLPVSSLPAFNNELATIEADAVQDMGSDTLSRFGAIMQRQVRDRITRNGNMLPGDQLSGPGSVIAEINSRARSLWRSQDPQDRTLASYLDRVENALMDHADIPKGRGALDTARNSYARYKDLVRASGEDGFVDPGRMENELRRQNVDMFARGRMRQQPFVQAARRAGVPSIREAHPQTSPLLEGLGIGAGVGAGGIHPSWLLAAAKGLPAALLYTPGGMSTLAAIANQARRIGALGGVGAGQAAPAVAPPPTNYGVTPGR